MLPTMELQLGISLESTICCLLLSAVSLEFGVDVSCEAFPLLITRLSVSLSAVFSSLTHTSTRTDAMKTEEERPSSRHERSRPPDTGLPPPLIPVDFGYWKLAPPALGLLGLGVYAGFRKQVRCML